MYTPLPYQIISAPKSVLIPELLKLDTGSSWITWCYSGFMKNYTDNHQPYVYVGFRMYTNNCVSTELTFIRVLLTSLELVRIGSIWKDATLVGICHFEKDEYFTVDFTRDTYRVVSFYDALHSNTQVPYPQKIFPLDMDADKSHYLIFESDKGQLIIPCLEFFSRCYGSSQEIKRIIATYPFSGYQENAYDKIIASSIDKNNKAWTIKLEKYLVEADAILAAHIKYDEYARYRVMKIQATIQELFTQGKRLLFVKIFPWFEGKARLKVEGISFNEGRSFLATQVLGCSNPPDHTVTLEKENVKNNSSNTNTDKFSVPRTTNISKKYPPIIDLTEYEDPDNNAEKINIYGAPFEIIGPRRLIIKRKLTQTRERNQISLIRTNANRYSAGADHGSGKGIGKAVFQAPGISDTNGVFIDMWKGFLLLQKAFSQVIQSVEYYTCRYGFANTAIPKLNLLRPSINILSVSRDVISWSYIDKPQNQQRKLLVVRLLIQSKQVYFFEIERRIRSKSNTEESFCGLVFTLNTNTEDELKKWVFKASRLICINKGKMNQVIKHCPGTAKTYRHKVREGSPQESMKTIQNALGKIDIFL